MPPDVPNVCLSGKTESGWHTAKTTRLTHSGPSKRPTAPRQSARVFLPHAWPLEEAHATAGVHRRARQCCAMAAGSAGAAARHPYRRISELSIGPKLPTPAEIGRASCRERGEECEDGGV